LTGAPLRVPNIVREKNVREDFRATKKICATMPHCWLSKILFHHGNRAHYNGRIPQYTRSSIGSSVNGIF
jgi:hypothetical protein